MPRLLLKGLFVDPGFACGPLTAHRTLLLLGGCIQLASPFCCEANVSRSKDLPVSPKVPLRKGPHPKRLSAEKVKDIVEATLHSMPHNATHWSTHTMAKTQGVSRASIARIWGAYGLQPHRISTFKLSRDKRFVEKLTDVVGVYLDPPDRARVLCVDEKSQIQALDRTQPGLPLKKGRCGTMTYD